jgi:hypothetical protein
MSALENLAATKSRADSRANFENFIAGRRAAGWTETDVTDYTESISALMGDDDAAALDLFPVGTFQNAEQARQEARAYWAKHPHFNKPDQEKHQ